jgi:hypothetical protein
MGELCSDTRITKYFFIGANQTPTTVASLEKATLSGLRMNDAAWQRGSISSHLVVGAGTSVLTAEPSLASRVMLDVPPMPYNVSGLFGVTCVGGSAGLPTRNTVCRTA